MTLRLLAMRCGRPVCVAVIALGLLGSARGAPQAADSTIPEELQAIAAACRQNSARLRTLQLSGRMTYTGKILEGQWDSISGLTYDSQTREFSIWMEATNVRSDETVDREVDGATGEVIYNLPYGDHITSYAKLAREGGLDALKARYGTPQSTKRTIVTADRCYEYAPESNELHLDRAGVRRMEAQGQVRLALNKTLAGGALAGGMYTFPELLERWSELPGRRATNVTPLGEGQYLVRLERFIDAPEPGATRHRALELVVDLHKGGNVISYIEQSDGRTVVRGDFDYMNVNGVWLLAHGEVADQITADGVPLVNAVYEVTPESVRVNEPIDPQVFTFEALDVRKGALVVDHKTGEEYLYDDIPLHLKVALAAAREWEEEAAEEAARTGQTGPPGQAEPLPEMPQLSAEDWQAAARQAGAPPGGAAPPRGVTPAGPAARGTTGPNSIVMLTPETRPARQADTKADQPPVDTRPIATQPVPEVQVLQKEDRAAEPALAEAAPVQAPAAGRWGVPSAAVTAVVVSAGCAAAAGIGIWKLLRRPAPPRAGS